MQNNVVFEAEDICTNILLRLPAKSLLRCKSVCRYWRSLNDDPRFIRLYLIQSDQETPTCAYVCFPYHGEGGKGNFLIRMDGETPIRFGGLLLDRRLCFKGMACTSELGSILKGAYLLGLGLNVAAGEIHVRTPDEKNNYDGISSFTSEYLNTFGVCFGPEIDGYKIFQFFYVKERAYECRIYSSITGTWKSIGTVPHAPAPSTCYNHVCINGIVYWLSEYMMGILAVDWEQNFSIIRFPRETRSPSFLINLEGCLSLVIMELGTNSLEIWALQDSKESVWVKKGSDPRLPQQFQEDGPRYAAVRKNELLFVNVGFRALYNMATSSWGKFDKDSGWWAHIPLTQSECLLALT